MEYKKILDEGGKAVGDSTSQVPKKFLNSTIEYGLEDVGLSDIKYELVGNVSSEFLGDVDAAVDVEELAKKWSLPKPYFSKEFWDAIKSHLDGIENAKITPGLKIFHIPARLVDSSGNQQPSFIDGKEIEGTEGIVQIDFFVGSLKWMKDVISGKPPGSNFKAFFRNWFLGTIISTVDRFKTEPKVTKEFPQGEFEEHKYIMDNATGIEKVVTKFANPAGKSKNPKTISSKREMFISDQNQLAEWLFGKGKTWKDIGSFEGVADNFKNNKYFNKKYGQYKEEIIVKLKQAFSQEQLEQIKNGGFGDIFGLEESLNESLLLEGGAHGHMPHLYENGSLTFANLKDIFTRAASGKLIGTEKTDGQNLMISFSVKEGRAKGARKPLDFKQGGATPEQLTDRFAGHENEALKDTFADALRIFEKAVKGLDTATQEELFGPDTNIYYNAEVMDPRSPNTIHYDTKSLVIHRAGHAEIDRTTGKKLPTDVSEKAKKLEDIIIAAQEKIKDENYGLQVNAIKNLEALSDQKPLNDAIEKIDRLLSSTNYLLRQQNYLNDESTIDQYMLARVNILVNNYLNKQLSEIGEVKAIAKLNIAKNIVGAEGRLTATQIYKDLTPKEKIYVKENLLNEEAKEKILNEAILPLEEIIFEFATEMLVGLKSAFVIDSSKEIKRLQAEVSKAIEELKKSDQEEFMLQLKKNLEKLRSVEKIKTATEGFVFDYEGVTYKFTGNFNPANQLLWLYRKMQKTSSPKTVTTEGKKKIKESPIKRIIGIYGGRFQPMGKHHIEVFRSAQQEFGEDNTFITTTDIVELPKSPLNFAEKKAVMVQQDIPEDKIIKVANPYKTDEIYQIVDPSTTALVFIVGKKDMEPDEETGKPPRIKITDKNNYLKHKEENSFLPMSEGDSAYYVFVAPHVTSEVTVTKEDGTSEEIKFDSSTVLRKKLAEGDKNVFKAIMGFYTPAIYDFLVQKFKESTSYVKPEKVKKTTKKTEKPKKGTKKKKSLKENIIDDIIEELLENKIIQNYDIVDEMIQEHIVKRKNKFCLVSKKSGRNLGCYRSRSGAKKREKQVQYFKYLKKETSMAGGVSPAVQGSPVKTKYYEEETIDG